MNQQSPFNDRETKHRRVRGGELLRHALGDVFLEGVNKLVREKTQ